MSYRSIVSFIFASERSPLILKIESFTAWNYPMYSVKYQLNAEDLWAKINITIFLRPDISYMSTGGSLNAPLVKSNCFSIS